MGKGRGLRTSSYSLSKQLHFIIWNFNMIAPYYAHNLKPNKI